MKLKSFGCSFIFGTDLPDDSRYGPMGWPSALTYPSLISMKKDMEHSCHARPGAGNFEILCRLLEQIAIGEPAIYMINWTWIERFSYIDENRSSGTHRFNTLGWHSIMPVDDNAISDFYYRHLHTELRDKLQTLTCAKSALDTLRSTGSQFIMTWTDPLMWDERWYNSKLVTWLQQQVQPYCSSFEGTSFVEWSRRRGFEISPTMHPLEQAHRAAADLILSNWDSYVRS